MAKKKLTEWRIRREWCKSCGICVHFCPKQVLDFDEDGKAEAVRPEECVCCKNCEMRCPDLAILVFCEG